MPTKYLHKSKKLNGGMVSKAYADNDNKIAIETKINNPDLQSR